MSYNINPESLLIAADVIADGKEDFLCGAIRWVAKDSVSRSEFEIFLRHNNIETSGHFREVGSEQKYERVAVCNHRVIFALMLREMILDNAI